MWDAAVANSAALYNILCPDGMGCLYVANRAQALPPGLGFLGICWEACQLLQGFSAVCITYKAKGALYFS